MYPSISTMTPQKPVIEELKVWMPTYFRNRLDIYLNFHLPQNTSRCDRMARRRKISIEFFWHRSYGEEPVSRLRRLVAGLSKMVCRGLVTIRRMVMQYGQWSFQKTGSISLLAAKIMRFGCGRYWRQKKTVTLTSSRRTPLARKAREFDSMRLSSKERRYENTVVIQRAF